MKTKFTLTAFFCLFVSIIAWAQAPVANFKADVVKGCSPIIINFTDQSTGKPTSWKWDFGNGVTSTKQHPSTSYFKPGKYTITLTVTNASGNNVMRKTEFINVFEDPKVQFTADKTAGCFPTDIAFKDLSTPGAGNTNTTWLWDFGNGTQSTQQNPSIAFKSDGDFDITLKVTNDKGCVSLATKPSYIKIAPGTTANFTNAQPTVCRAPATVTFNNTSNGPGTLSYVWDFGNGDTSHAKTPSYTYKDTGSYTVKLIATSSSGCVDSITKTNAVKFGGNIPNFTVPDVVCANAPATFINTSTPTPVSNTWIFSNGTTSTDKNGVIVFGTAGTYNVQLISKFSTCTDSVTKQITAIAKPKATFTAPQVNSCQPPLTVSFNNASLNAVSYKWDFGDSTTSTEAAPTHTYTRYGNFTVKLIAFNANGCSDTLARGSYIKIRKPTIRFSKLPVTGCVPYLITPTATISTVDTVKSYLWNFGDGGTSTEAKPSYTYNNRGTYDVSLTITTSSGCTVTYTLAKAVKVGTKPLPQFSVYPGDDCASTAIQFTNQSMPANEVDKFKWFFGDGTTSTAKNPKHLYQDTGWFNVKLVAFNNGCPDTITNNRVVHIKTPIARFSYRPDCYYKLEYTFTDKSLGAKTWFWNFGDGTTDTARNPQVHKFPKNGTYKVSLLVTNDTCSYITTRTIQVSDVKPNITATTQVACKSTSIKFTASTPNKGLIKTYTWDFGDGKQVVTTANNRSFTYTQTGNYTVSMFTTDSFGCKDTVIKEKFIRINGPKADFSGTSLSGCKGMTATFADNSIPDDQNKIVKWTWNYGDGKTQVYTSAPFQHVYDSTGKFSVNLKVEDAAGCSDNITKTEMVNISLIKADWSSVKESCPGAKITFSNKTTGPSFTSVWDFGNNVTSTAKSPAQAFADTGTYSVKLIVQDAVGCSDSLVQQVFIGKPIADFTANNFTTYCTPFQAKFTNTSSYFTSSLWSLGTGTSKLKNPTNYYTSKGIYDVKLTVTSVGGCKDSVTKQMRILGANDATIAYNPNEGCAPLTVSMDAFTKMNGHFIWDMGDGNIKDTSVNTIDYTYNTFGKYLPKVILIEPGGCIIPVAGKDTIHAYGLNANFNLNKTFLCDSGLVTITNNITTSNPIKTYNWNFGDGTTSTSATVSHLYNKPGTYNVTLIVENEKGCKDTVVSKPLTLAVSPLIAIAGDSVICLNERLEHFGIAVGQDTTALSWRWNFPDGSTSNMQNPGIKQYTKAGIFDIRTIATNKSGCSDTATSKVRINALPTVDMPSTLTMMIGVPVTIPAIYSNNVTSYTWSPAIGLNCVNCPQPIANPKYGSKYTVSFIDSNGCKNTGSIQMIVTCKDANVFLPNTFSPNGDGVNDIFYVRGRGIFRVKHLRLFNRWGEVVFEKRDFDINDATAGWDGTYKGAKAQPDVYVYQVDAFCDNGEIITYTGNVALLQ